MADKLRRSQLLTAVRYTIRRLQGRRGRAASRIYGGLRGECDLQFDRLAVLRLGQWLRASGYVQETASVCSRGMRDHTPQPAEALRPHKSPRGGDQSRGR